MVSSYSPTGGRIEFTLDFISSQLSFLTVLLILEDISKFFVRFISVLTFSSSELSSLEASYSAINVFGSKKVRADAFSLLVLWWSFIPYLDVALITILALIEDKLVSLINLLRSESLFNSE